MYLETFKCISSILWIKTDKTSNAFRDKRELMGESKVLIVSLLWSCTSNS